MLMVPAAWYSGLVNLLDGRSTLHRNKTLKESVEQTVRGSSLQLAAGLRPSSQLLAWGCCYSDPSQRSADIASALDYSMAFGKLLETACPCVLPSDFPQQVKDGVDDDDLSR